MNHIRTYLIALLAIGVILATTAAGCGSGGASSAHGGRTLVVPGTGAPASCTQTPYDMALDEQEPDGTGVVVQHGYVRGAVWVACTGKVTAFSIKVVLLRNGLDYGTPRTYAAIPNPTGYAASVFDHCQAGVYRVQYDYEWSANGGTVGDLTTTPISETVTQHDCDS